MMDKLSLDRQSLDLAALVQGTLATLRETGELTEGRVEVSLAPVWVSADPTRMDQVIENLVTNALKYTPTSGDIFVSVCREGEQAVLRVRDTGLGIESELLPHIFDLFVQGQRSLDRSQGGLGIGLTLVQRLTQLHGGSVEVKSDGPGLGSEFIVRLPAVAPPAQIEADSGVASSIDRIESRTVVIVEDNEDARASLRQLLELEGHHVSEAHDGPSGLKAVLSADADIAFIDIGLPLLDGYELVRQIRAQQSYPIRLVAMTGYGSRQDIDRGLDAGFDAYLVKPVDPEQLTSLVASAPRATRRRPSSDA